MKTNTINPTQYNIKNLFKIERNMTFRQENKIT